MGYKFYPINREQMFLLPPSLADWLPKKHIVWMILDIVDNIDLNPFLKRYNPDGLGHVAYHPRMLISVFL